MCEGSVGFSVLVAFDVFCVDIDGEGLDDCPDCDNQIIVGLFFGCGQKPGYRILIASRLLHAIVMLPCVMWNS